MEWPVKKSYTAWETNTPDGLYNKGWNACHAYFMAVINRTADASKTIDPNSHDYMAGFRDGRKSEQLKEFSGYMTETPKVSNGFSDTDMMKEDEKPEPQQEKKCEHHWLPPVKHGDGFICEKCGKEQQEKKLIPCSIKSIYEKYEHMNKLFSNPSWMGIDEDSGDGYALRHIMFDMWKAIKEFNTRPSAHEKQRLVELDEAKVYAVLERIIGHCEDMSKEYEAIQYAPIRTMAQAICEEFGSPKAVVSVPTVEELAKIMYYHSVEWNCRRDIKVAGWEFSNKESKEFWLSKATAIKNLIENK